MSDNTEKDAEIITLLTPRIIYCDNTAIVRRTWAAIRQLRKTLPHLFRPIIINQFDVKVFDINPNQWLEIVDLEEYHKALDILMDMYRL